MLTHGSHLIDITRFLGGPLVAVRGRRKEMFGAYSWFVEVEFAQRRSGTSRLDGRRAHGLPRGLSHLRGTRQRGRQNLPAVVFEIQRCRVLFHARWPISPTARGRRALLPAATRRFCRRRPARCAPDGGRCGGWNSNDAGHGRHCPLGRKRRLGPLGGPSPAAYSGLCLRLVLVYGPSICSAALSSWCSCGSGCPKAPIDSDR